MLEVHTDEQCSCTCLKCPIKHFLFQSHASNQMYTVQDTLVGVYMYFEQILANQLWVPTQNNSWWGIWGRISWVLQWTKGWKIGEMTCNTAQHGGFFSSTGYVCTCMCVFLFCYGLTTCSMEGTQLWKGSLEWEVLGPARSVILLERVSGKYFKQILANQPWAPTQGTGQHVTCCICRSVEGKKGGMGWLEEYKKKKRNAKRSAPYCLRILRCQLWHMDMNLYLWQKELTGKAHWGFNGSLCWSVISFNSAWYKNKKKN